jgi:DNA-binding GntR family transcriptional regulator
MKLLQPALIRSTPLSVPAALPRQTLVDTAVAALRERILSGEFTEGESLNQVAIAREYAISRIPLREAMRQLEAEGLLLFQPGKGAIIPGLSLNEIAEVVDLRALLEPELLEKAIPHFKPADFDEASGILDQFEMALRNGDIATWGEFNWRFHSTLYAPSGCTLAMGIVKSLHRFNQRYARIQISLTKWERRAAREHRAILALCRRREKRKVVRLMREHIVTAGEALICVLEERRSANSNIAETN